MARGRKERIARKVREMARLGFGLHLQDKGARGENLLLFLEGAVAIPDRQDGARSEKPRLAGVR